ncbi:MULTISPECIES: conjugal transfer protein TraL [Pseudoalteromonas]|uniref:nucleotide-binding protein n=1 Tax=Pseudoalteromonas TaxID=53246 RepID=UPI001EF6A904|nr:conjugal transfer protein TraL [Pseudoalteromonas sp. Of11M-6]MCG7556059.1 conjugal transfer protein TraL [Pseudoalteromonas sp. Of11M-6]
MAKIHMILQGKGGVGKSLCCSLLAQYTQSLNVPALCIDTDPVNATFTGYSKLDVKKLDIMEGDEINPRNFDLLIEWIAQTDKENVVIDNGASTFVPLAHYMLSNEIPELLASMGHELIIHTVVTGGQALVDTINGFAHVTRQFSLSKVVVWLNCYWGEIEYEGRGFEELKAYKNNKDNVFAIINIPQFKKETFGQDLSDVLSDRLTFDEAINTDGLSIMSKQRLKIIKSQLYENIKLSGVI